MAEYGVAGSTVFYSGLECVVVKGTGPELMKQFLEMGEQGKKEGFVPLIVFRDEESEETGKGNDEIYRQIYRDRVLAEAAEIDVESWLEEESKGLTDPEFCEFMDEMEKNSENTGERQGELAVPSSGVTMIVIAKVPAKNPWEVFAYIPFGGWNSCPSDDVLMAVSKRWYEGYGAVPCALSHDTLQYYLEKPVSAEEAGRLANEMFFVCSDIVLQGTGTINNLKKSITDSPFWFFWWD